MKKTHGKLEGDLTVSEDFELHGTASGNAVVKSGATLQLHGTVGGDLHVEPGAIVGLHGTVNGDAVNDGGILRVFGTIHGTLIQNSGDTAVDDRAVIDGGIRGAVTMVHRHSPVEAL